MKSTTDRQLRTASTPPSRGVTDETTLALVPDKAPPDLPDAPSSTAPALTLRPTKPGGHLPQCEGTGKTGRQCGNLRTREYWIDGSTKSWRCRHHGKGLTPVQDALGITVGQPPVTRLKTKADAERFLQWLLQAAVTKAYGASDIKGILMIVARWDRVRQRWEQELAESMDRLYQRMRAEVKATREYVKEHGDTGGEDDAPGADTLGQRADKLEELIGCWRAEFNRLKRTAA